MLEFRAWRFFLLYFLLGATRVAATEYQPWLGNFLEFEWRSSLLYQEYSSVSSASHSKKSRANDLFLNVSLSTSLTSFGFEIETTEARTRRQKGDIDQIKMTGRYRWQDDIAGDSLSLTTGLSFIESFRNSLKDISSFHHGRSEAELFVSFGKEAAQEITWGTRWWGVAGIGVADRGSPWLRFNLTYEKRLQDKHEFKIFAHSLWGLGHQRLHRRNFHGYGPIQHQSIDIGIGYTYLLEYFGSASLEYSYRIHARNFPLYAHRLWVQLLYTFGI